MLKLRKLYGTFMHLFAENKKVKKRVRRKLRGIRVLGMKQEIECGRCDRMRDAGLFLCERCLYIIRMNEKG